MFGERLLDRRGAAGPRRIFTRLGPELAAIADIHVGVISSSLGDGGDNEVCSSPESRDMAHLLGSLERGTAASVGDHGVLKWQAGQSVEAFRSSLETMALAAGQQGCAYEASLEAWYRFLVDPEPFASLERVPCFSGDAELGCIGPAVDASGEISIDQTLLAQRAEFLRPDSVLIVLALTDENDCSIRAGSQSWLVSSRTETMTRASSACAENPNAA